ncbi:MAG: methyltransferase domain-containing protein, partial [Rhodopila sp.]|nr:methyltransferase domain-containing protein [Rhodopila sp.]
MISTEPDSGEYGARFYEDHADGSLRSARVVLGQVFGWLSPGTVVDVGCGVGTWLLAARELGAKQVLGLDGDYVDRDQLRISPADFLAVDMERQDLRAVLPPHHVPPFDLVMCLEVAEHLSAGRAAGFVRELTRLGDVVLFSAAIPFQGGVHHVNEQWPEYWALLFAGEGYQCLDPLRRGLWYRDDIEWWYAQNALLFVRRGSAALARIPGGQADTNAPLALVHPQNLLFQVLHTFRVHRAAAAEEEVRDYEALAAAWRAGAATLPPLAAAERAIAHPDAADVFPHTRMQVIVPELELAARDAAIFRGSEEQAVLRQELAARDAEISRQLEEVTTLRHDLADRDAAILRATEEQAVLRQELAARDAEISRQLEEVTTLRHDLADRDAAILRAT